MKFAIKRYGSDECIEDTPLENWEEALAFVRGKFDVNPSAVIYEEQDYTDNRKAVRVRDRQNVIIYQLKTLL